MNNGFPTQQNGPVNPQQGFQQAPSPQAGYVPPHMRNQAANQARQPSGNGGAAWGGAPQQQQQQGGGGRFQNQGQQGGGRFQNQGQQNGGGRFGGYQNQGRQGGGRGGGGGGGGGFNRSRGYGGGSGGRFQGGGGRGGGNAQDRSKEPNERLQKELFGDVTSMAQGIAFDEYDDIPVEVSGEEIPDGITDFSSVADCNPQLAENIALAGYQKPTPVQKHSFPIGMASRDLMACAQTGSGKTAGFLFPLIHRLAEAGIGDAPPKQEGYGSRTKFFPSSLILSPTRELTTQIYNQARKFLFRTGMRACVVYGGADFREQLRDLERGCDVLVATPGRLTDFIDRGRVSLCEIQILCLDEADRMLDMGFEPQIRQIVEKEDMPRTRQTLMFSATFPREIQFLAQDFLTNYVFLAVGRVGSTTENITQKVEYAEDRDKKEVLMHLLSECEGLTLVFVQTKRAADMIEDYLCREGINATSIHGDRSQREREMALRQFKDGQCPVLVATDVASRGLDIPNVMYVINYDLPSSIDDYVHRIGRTGRCGNKGTAISLCNENNKNVLKDLNELMTEANQDVPRWFEDLVRSCSFGRGKGGKGRGKGNRFGGRDVRKNKGGGGGGGGHQGGNNRNNGPPRQNFQAGGFQQSSAPQQNGWGGGNRGGGYGGSFNSGSDAW